MIQYKTMAVFSALICCSIGQLLANNISISAIDATDDVVVILDKDGKTNPLVECNVSLVRVASDFSGRVVVTNSSRDKYKVWEDSGKTTEATELNVSSGNFDSGVPVARLYVEGLTPGKGTITVDLRDGSGKSQSTDSMDVNVVKVNLKSVSFTGESYLELCKDADPNTLYEAPHWQDTSGPPDGVPEKNYSVAYAKNTYPLIGATLVVTDASSWDSIKVRVTGPDDVSIPETELEISGSGDDVTLHDTISEEPLPDEIRFYKKSSPSHSFKLEWEVQVEDSGWVKVATTHHQVYVVRDWVSLTNSRETLFYLACNKPNGNDGNDSLAVANLIYEEFQDWLVYRLDPTTGTEDTTDPLKYHGGGAGTHMLEIMGGTCGGFANFLQEVLSVQSINSETYGVTARQWGHIPSDFECQQFVLKSVTISGGTDTEPARTPPRPPHQGLGAAPQVQTEWGAHRILKAENHYYDPSYGTPPFADQPNWENGSIDALRGIKGKDWWGHDKPYWIPDTAGLDVVFSVYVPVP